MNAEAITKLKKIRDDVARWFEAFGSELIAFDKSNRKLHHVVTKLQWVVDLLDEMEEALDPDGIPRPLDRNR